MERVTQEEQDYDERTPKQLLHPKKKIQNTDLRGAGVAQSV
jgi:hypothetical protein